MNLPRIGLSIGDVNGIGLEVIIKSLLALKFEKKFIPVIYGSSKLFGYHKNMVTRSEIVYHIVKEAGKYADGKINIVNCWDEQVAVKLGEINELGGKYAAISLEMAVNGLKNNHIDALVTAPIHKKSMELGGFNYPGHTEFLTNAFAPAKSMMIMVSDTLRVGLVTGHISLQDVSKSITKDLVLQKAELFIQSLNKDFGIDKPKLAVLGLNPHAGDEGLFGDEEAKVIKPAIEILKKNGHVVMGPYPADGFFGSGNFQKFDGILAMYHDQGLIPFKTLAFGGGVNFTAGIPAIRTSPDHGTGFDIAGKNMASASSMMQAIYLAIDVYHTQKELNTLISNQLKKKKIIEDVEDEIIEDLD